jgi:O-antigen/teichoic acid export membrane protein
MAIVGTADSSPALVTGAQPAGDASPAKLLGRASVAGAGAIYQQCVSFASGVIVARVLGAADYGVFNLARNLVDTTSLLTRAGLDVGLQRHFGETRAVPDHAARALVLRQVRVLVSILALVPVAAVALGLGRVLEENVYPHAGFAQLLLCLALGLPFVSDLCVLGGAYRGSLKLTPSVLAESVLMPTARLLIILALFLLGWRLWAVALGTTLGAVLASGWLALRARRDFAARAQPSASWAQSRRVLRYSSVMAAATLVTTLTSTMDILTLGRYVSAEQLGQYSLAKTLFVLTGFFAIAFSQGLGGMVADRHVQGDREGLLRVMSLTFQWIALGTLPVFAIFLFWGAQITQLFGPSFTISPAVVAWLAGGQFVLALFGQMGWALSMTGRHVLEFRILASGLAVAAVLCFIAVPVYGQLGAAIATFCAIVIVNGSRMFFVRRALGGLPLDGRLVLFAAAGLSVAFAAKLASAQLPLGLFWSCCAGVGIFLPCYVAACWWYLHTTATRRARGATVATGQYQ